MADDTRDVGEGRESGRESGSGRTPLIGGVAALLVAAGYLATMPVFATVGAPPVGAEARLVYHADAGGAWWAIVALSVATDLLLIPVALALHDALRPIDGGLARLAAISIFTFVILDLAVTWPAYVALISLGERYALTATAHERALLIAAAGYPSAILGSPLQAVDSVLTLSIGILVGAIAMARGRRRAVPAEVRPPFTRMTVVIGIAAGAVGIASVAQTAGSGAVSPLVIAASLLTIVWLVSVGRDLLRGRHQAGSTDRLAR